MQSYLEQKAKRQSVFKLSLIGFKGGNAVGPGDYVLSAKREKATAMVHALYTSTFNQNIDNIKVITIALANATMYGTGYPVFFEC
jgi:hypothetical protein